MSLHDGSSHRRTAPDGGIPRHGTLSGVDRVASGISTRRDHSFFAQLGGSRTNCTTDQCPSRTGPGHAPLDCDRSRRWAHFALTSRLYRFSFCFNGGCPSSSGCGLWRCGGHRQGTPCSRDQHEHGARVGREQQSHESHYRQSGVWSTPRTGLQIRRGRDEWPAGQWRDSLRQAFPRAWRHVDGFTQGFAGCRCRPDATRERGTGAVSLCRPTRTSRGDDRPRSLPGA